MTNSISCIVPFLNEEERIFKVLDELVKVKNLSEIICVDDGSTDRASEKIAQKYPQIRLLRQPENHGKTEAVRQGLKAAVGDDILLMDADLDHVDHKEIEAAIDYYQQNNIDMLILRRMDEFWFMKLSGIDIVLAGERIMRKKDLAEILNLPVEKYQMELAINSYMRQKRSKILWFPYSARPIHKIEKTGFIKGMKKEAEMFSDLFAFVGAKEFFKQSISFTGKKAKLRRSRKKPFSFKKETSDFTQTK